MVHCLMAELQLSTCQKELKLMPRWAGRLTLVRTKDMITIRLRGCSIYARATAAKRPAANAPIAGLTLLAAPVKVAIGVGAT